MANTIYNIITIEPVEAMDKICELLDSQENLGYGKETTAIVKVIYNQNDLKRNLKDRLYKNGTTDNPITDDGVDNGWCFDNIGVKWIMGGVDDDIKIDSANYTPDGLLCKLYELALEVDPLNAEVHCKWYDEFETEFGTSYIKNGIYTETYDDDLEFMSLDEADMDCDEYGLIKWDEIIDVWKKQRLLCSEAIGENDDVDFEFQISKVVRIADLDGEYDEEKETLVGKFVMLENYYPFNKNV
jgi:hypothetical protein